MHNVPNLFSKNRPSSIDSDIIFIGQDKKKKGLAPKGAYSELAKKLLQSGIFKGDFQSLEFIRFGGLNGAKNVLFVGVGEPSDLTELKIRELGGLVFQKLESQKSVVNSVSLDSMKALKAPVRLPKVVGLFSEALSLCGYEYEKKSASKKKEKNEKKTLNFYFSGKDAGKVKGELERASVIGPAVNVCRDWSNHPSNWGHPEFFAAEAKKLAPQYGLKCKVLNESEIKKEKMGLFLGVGQGSARENRLVILEYVPKAKKKSKTVCLVGKGITFDSGGISLKPGSRMEEMKHDMTGAATVMGAILLASKWKVPHRVIAVMAFAENMPGGNAVTPSSVLSSRSGKTVEIINTDAEGRLILADALDYAQKYKPNYMVDVATLTGAVLVALGKQGCGVMGNQDGFVKKILSAGEQSGERAWQLPLWEEYFEDLKSDVADLKNHANSPNHGTIRGGMFLKQFVQDQVNWAHLDIAGTAWDVSHFSYIPRKGATGLQVRTLAQLIANLS